MKATRIFSDRLVVGDGDFADLVIWKVPSPVPPAIHGIKYRLAYIVEGVRVIGFETNGARVTTGMMSGWKRSIASRAPSD